MENRISTNYAVTRRQKRAIAKEKMKKEGKKNFCKHSYTTLSIKGYPMTTREPSEFAESWRDYI